MKCIEIMRTEVCLRQEISVFLFVHRIFCVFYIYIFPIFATQMVYIKKIRYIYIVFIFFYKCSTSNLFQIKSETGKWYCQQRWFSLYWYQHSVSMCLLIECVSKLNFLEIQLLKVFIRYQIDEMRQPLTIYSIVKNQTKWTQ